jgi:hypothetical protein
MAAELTIDARWACLVADLLEAKQIEPEGLQPRASYGAFLEAPPALDDPARRGATQPKWPPQKERPPRKRMPHTRRRPDLGLSRKLEHGRSIR